MRFIWTQPCHSLNYTQYLVLLNISINLETTRFNLVRRLNTKNYKVTSASFRHALLPTDLTASWCGNGFVSISTLITPLEVGRNKFQP